MFPQASHYPHLARVGIAGHKFSETLSLQASQAFRENLWSHEGSGMFHVHSIHQFTAVGPGEGVGGQAKALVPIHVCNKHQVAMTHKLPRCVMLLVLLFHLLLLSLCVTHTVHVPKASVPHFPSQREDNTVSSGGIISFDLRTRAVKASRPSSKGRHLLPCTGRFD